VHALTGFVNQAALRDAVAQVTKALDSREVRDVRFTLGSDSSGEPSIFFGILLTPYASHHSRLADVTGEWQRCYLINFNLTITGDSSLTLTSPQIRRISAIRAGCNVINGVCRRPPQAGILLLNKEPKLLPQASLRRSVSTAYYALFHLLIQDASANWSRLDTRDYLARAFEHKTMRRHPRGQRTPRMIHQSLRRWWPSCAPLQGHSGNFSFNAISQITATRLSGIGSRHHPKLTNPRPLLVTGRQSAMSMLLSDISSLF